MRSAEHGTGDARRRAADGISLGDDRRDCAGAGPPRPPGADDPSIQRADRGSVWRSLSLRRARRGAHLRTRYGGTSKSHPPLAKARPLPFASEQSFRKAQVFRMRQCRSANPVNRCERHARRARGETRPDADRSFSQDGDGRRNTHRPRGGERFLFGLCSRISPEVGLRRWAFFSSLLTSDGRR